MKFVSLSILTLATLTVNAQTSLTGRYIATADFYGTPLVLRLELDQKGTILTGKLNGDPLQGTVAGTSVHFLAKDEQGGTSEATGSFKNGVLSATLIETDVDDKAHPQTYPFTAKLAPARPNGPPRRHEFTPTVYYRQYSALNKPVLTVSPGDTIHTTTVDAGGNDFQGVKRVAGGNPQTGPFYIESAMPGDTLVVHINHLKLIATGRSAMTASSNEQPPALSPSR